MNGERWFVLAIWIAILIFCSLCWAWFIKAVF